MTFWEVLVLGLGLSMDAFAIAICKGLNLKKFSIFYAFVISFAFGFFQFLMPIIGFYFCSQFESYIKSFDHWIVFVLLAFIGIKMIVEAFENDKKEIKNNEFNFNKKPVNLDKNIVNNDIVSSENSNKSLNTEKINIKEIFVLAIATSIDALAAGIALACTTNKNVFLSCGSIGIITFVLSFIGVVIGNFFGEKFKKPAEIVGGVILVLIGLKVLLEHLNIIAF